MGEPEREGSYMGKAIEISVWEPHAGKLDDFLEIFGKFKKAFLEAGVSQVQVLTGVAGKDVNNVVVIQTFKGLADNGAINESISESEALKALRAQEFRSFPANIVSHDLYEVIDD